MSKSVDFTPKVSLILGMIHAARRRDNARAAMTIFFEPWTATRTNRRLALCTLCRNGDLEAFRVYVLN